MAEKNTGLARRVKKDFPIFQKNKGLVYLDSAATSQKPMQVIHAMKEFYERYNSNVHRAAYRIGEEATELFEGARKTTAKFIGAARREIVFTKNTTEALNLVANCIAKSRLGKNDKILLTEMEHHSNIVPWMIATENSKAKIDFLKINDKGILDEKSVDEKLSQKPQVFSFTQTSNVLGTINDADGLCKMAKKAGALSVVDAAQSVPHMPVDVKKMGCDFMAFSGHKMLGPLGIGVLYARYELLEELPPFMGGGNMIREVHFDSFISDDPPGKFEAGTPPVAEAVGLAEAMHYLEAIEMKNILSHEQELAKVALDVLGEIKNLEIYGPEWNKRVAVVSFNVKGIPGHDMASLLDGRGIAVRTGHHCAMPLHLRLGIDGSVRASFYIYNSEEDVHALAEGIKHAKKVFGV